MQRATKAIIVSGACALSACVITILNPQPISLPTATYSTRNTPHISVYEKMETKEAPSIHIKMPEPEVYCPWNLKTAKDLDFDLIQMVTKQSLSHQLEESCDIAKQKALQIGEWGFPSCSNLRFYDSYCSSINYYRSHPNWCGEYLSRADLENNPAVKRRAKFYSDNSVPEKFRSVLADFKRSGFSRGHLVPAGDNNSCQKSNDLTFQLSSNIVPQEIRMNKKEWLNVEWFVKKLILSHDSDIENCWIFTGPVYKPIYDERDHSQPITGKVENAFVGKTMVHVPTHLFKVILADRGESGDMDHAERYQLAAFMVQNETISEKLALDDYLIDIDELEHLVGLEFFPKLRNRRVSYGELCDNYNCRGYNYQKDRNIMLPKETMERREQYKQY